LKLNFSN